MANPKNQNHINELNEKIRVAIKGMIGPHITDKDHSFGDGVSTSIKSLIARERNSVIQPDNDERDKLQVSVNAIVRKYANENGSQAELQTISRDKIDEVAKDMISLARENRDREVISNLINDHVRPYITSADKENGKEITAVIEAMIDENRDELQGNNSVAKTRIQKQINETLKAYATESGSTREFRAIPNKDINEIASLMRGEVLSSGRNTVFNSTPSPSSNSATIDEQLQDEVSVLNREISNILGRNIPDSREGKRAKQEILSKIEEKGLGTRYRDISPIHNKFVKAHGESVVVADRFVRADVESLAKAHNERSKAIHRYISSRAVNPEAYDETTPFPSNVDDSYSKLTDTILDYVPEGDGRSETIEKLLNYINDNRDSINTTNRLRGSKHTAEIRNIISSHYSNIGEEFRNTDGIPGQFMKSIAKTLSSQERALNQSVTESDASEQTKNFSLSNSEFDGYKNQEVVREIAKSRLLNDNQVLALLEGVESFIDTIPTGVIRRDSPLYQSINKSIFEAGDESWKANERKTGRANKNYIRGNDIKVISGVIINNEELKNEYNKNYNSVSKKIPLNRSKQANRSVDWAGIKHAHEISRNGNIQDIERAIKSVYDQRIPPGSNGNAVRFAVQEIIDDPSNRRFLANGPVRRGFSYNQAKRAVDEHAFANGSGPKAKYLTAGDLKKIAILSNSRDVALGIPRATNRYMFADSHAAFGSARPTWDNQQWNGFARRAEGQSNRYSAKPDQQNSKRVRFLLPGSVGYDGAVSPVIVEPGSSSIKPVWQNFQRNEFLQSGPVGYGGVAYPAVMRDGFGTVRTKLESSQGLSRTISELTSQMEQLRTEIQQGEPLITQSTPRRSINDNLLDQRPTTSLRLPATTQTPAFPQELGKSQLKAGDDVQAIDRKLSAAFDNEIMAGGVTRQFGLDIMDQISENRDWIPKWTNINGSFDETQISKRINALRRDGLRSQGKEPANSDKLSFDQLKTIADLYNQRSEAFANYAAHEIVSRSLNRDIGIRTENSPIQQIRQDPEGFADFTNSLSGMLTLKGSPATHDKDVDTVRSVINILMDRHESIGIDPAIDGYEINRVIAANPNISALQNEEIDVAAKLAARMESRSNIFLTGVNERDPLNTATDRIGPIFTNQPNQLDNSFSSLVDKYAGDHYRGDDNGGSLKTIIKDYITEHGEKSFSPESSARQEFNNGLRQLFRSHYEESGSTVNQKPIGDDDIRSLTSLIRIQAMQAAVTGKDAPTSEVPAPVAGNEISDASTPPSADDNGQPTPDVRSPVVQRDAPTSEVPASVAGNEISDASTTPSADDNEQPTPVRPRPVVQRDAPTSEVPAPAAESSRGRWGFAQKIGGFFGIGRAPALPRSRESSADNEERSSRESTASNSKMDIDPPVQSNNIPSPPPPIAPSSTSRASNETGHQSFSLHSKSLGSIEGATAPPLSRESSLDVTTRSLSGSHSLDPNMNVGPAVSATVQVTQTSSSIARVGSSSASREEGQANDGAVGVSQQRGIDKPDNAEKQVIEAESVGGSISKPNVGKKMQRDLNLANETMADSRQAKIHGSVTNENGNRKSSRLGGKSSAESQTQGSSSIARVGSSSASREEGQANDGAVGVSQQRGVDKPNVRRERNLTNEMPTAPKPTFLRRGDGTNRGAHRNANLVNNNQTQGSSNSGRAPAGERSDRNTRSR